MNILDALKQLRDDIKVWATNNFNALNAKIDEKTIPIDNKLDSSSTNPVQNKVVANAINNIPRFSGDYNDLTNAPNITEDDSGNMIITDENGNIIFKADSDGIHTTYLTLDGEQAATEKYVDDAIAEISTPDVSGQIQAHNTSEDAHEDIRQAIVEAKEELSESIVSESEEWHVVDNNGNIVATINANGIETTTIAAQNIILDNADIKVEIDNKQNKLIGVSGQIVGFDKNGNAIAQNINIEGSGEAVQSDWNVNDENDPTYIKNRPFYTSDTTEILLVDNVTVTIEIAEGKDEWIGGAEWLNVNISEDDFKLNKEYIVNINGATYNCISWTDGYDTYLGNGAIADNDFTNTGEPFFIEYSYKEEDMRLFVSGNLGDIQEYTVSVTLLDNIDITIPSKYLGLNIKNGEGKLSIVEGEGAIASGEGAHAEGCETIASGGYSHAEGYCSTASSYYSHVEGYYTTASGWSAHAEGENTTASGDRSHAEGANTTASGYASHAEGSDTKAFGEQSHAEGANTTASENSSHAEGRNTVASGENSHAEGYNTAASNNAAHAEGEDTKASGYASHAEGYNTEASGIDSHAEGNSTKASGEYSHAEGEQTIAFGESSHTEGYLTKATGGRAHAEGYQTIAYGHQSHAEGGSENTTIDIIGEASTITYTYNAADDNSIKVGMVIYYNDVYAKIINKDSSNSTITLDKTLSFDTSGTINVQLYRHAASGDFSHAEGYETISCGISSHAEGYDTEASGECSHAEGRNTMASGLVSHAEGHYTTASDLYSHSEGGHTTASGGYSHAEGNSTEASGNYSHAEGFNTAASGESSHAEGYETKASGENSHAEGSGTEASGLISHAEGINTVASGDASHSEGWGVKASGVFSHAEGYYTEAAGEVSHAEGYRTEAIGVYQHVQGQYNISDNVSAHIVGNGTSDTAHSNAHTLDWDGNAWFAGNVYVGSTSGTNKDSGSKKLVTVEEMNAAIAAAIEAALASINNAEEASF